jgi:hypothetical protein
MEMMWFGCVKDCFGRKLHQAVRERVNRYRCQGGQIMPTQTLKTPGETGRFCFLRKRQKRRKLERVGLAYHIGDVRFFILNSGGG